MNETRHRVLETIAEGPVTGPDLAETLAVSRAAIWKHVDALRDAGFEVASGPDGYELVDVPDFGGQAVEFGLGAPYSIEYHDTIESTNERGRELAARGERDVVVLADEQTGGRGRLDRSWASPGGGIWASVVLEPTVPTVRLPLFTLAGSIAVTDAAREAGVDAWIKWPNDVVVPCDDDRGYEKLAGVLSEVSGEAGRAHWLVVGFGVNANVPQAALPKGATSIAVRADEVDRRAFTQRLLDGFHACTSDLDEVLAVWRDRALTLGQVVRVETPDGTVEGEAVDVVEPGALVVDTGGERVTVHASDCEHLRPKSSC